VTRIRNSIRARHKSWITGVEAEDRDRPHPQGEGYIANYKAAEENGRAVLRLYLKYAPTTKQPSATCRAFRAPASASYVGRDESSASKRTGISIMTTPRGVMTGRQARREGVGGEILCEVW